MHTAPQYRIEDDNGEHADDADAFQSVLRYRFALWNLVLKDFRIRYRNMSLGFLWSLLNPLIMLGVLVVVFSYIHPQRHAHYFPVFLLIGMVTYNFFALCLPAATNSVLENAALVKKVIFPRVMVPISVVFSQTIHVAIQLLLVGVFLAIFRVPVRLAWLWVPPIYATMLVFVLGASCFCAALNVFYRDILYIVQSLLTVLFWLTPIFYDLSQVKLNLPPLLYHIYILNPMAGCIDAARRALLRGESPDLVSFGTAVLVAFLALIVGLRLFHRRQAHFADRL